MIGVVGRDARRICLPPQWLARHPVHLPNAFRYGDVAARKNKNAAVDFSTAAF
jgi:hypothetical protein